MAGGNTDQRNPKYIETVGDMIRRLEDEIADIKSGDLPHDAAKLVLRGREDQIKAAALNIAFARVNKMQRAQRGNVSEFSLNTGTLAAPADKPADDASGSKAA